MKWEPSDSSRIRRRHRGDGTIVDPQSSDRGKVDGNGRLRQTVVIANPQGLHLRPAMAFARLAQQFDAAVKVVKGNHCVNGKSLIDLLLLAAEQGTELILEVDGADARKAMPALTEILAAPSPESLGPDTTPPPDPA